MSDDGLNIFKAIYRQRGDGVPQTLDPQWRGRLLRQIRTLRLDAEPPLMWLFQQYIWRLAPVACALTLVLGVWITQTGLDPDLELVALALDNPISANLIAAFGL